MEKWPLYVEVFRLLMLCFVVVGAAYGDLKDSCISNRLTVSAIVAGFLLGALAGGLEGLRLSALGFLAGGGPLLLIYMIGLAGSKPLMGAGDVKLMAGVGAFAGPVGALWSIYYALWIAGGIAFCIVAFCMIAKRGIPKTLPFGACLAFGTLVAFWAHSEVFTSFIARGEIG